MKPEMPIRMSPTFESEFPGASATASEGVANLIRTGEILLTQVSTLLRHYGLSLTAVNILTILSGAGEPLPPHEIGERLLITRGGVTQLLDTLQKRSLVRRVAHPHDRRMLLIEITDEGKQLIQAVQPELFRCDVLWMGGLDTQEQKLLVELLGKIQIHLQNPAQCHE